MAPKTDLDSFVFDLNGDGEGGFYRVRMTNRPGEINRPVMINRGERFQILADLLDVAHGTLSDGDSATLIVASFCFLPSQDRRFKSAQITWTFTSDDPAVEVEVDSIAPTGSWSLNPTTGTDERTISGKADLGAASLITASGAGEYSMTQTRDRRFHTVLTGSKRVNERDYGGPDTARWDLEENPDQHTGIARMLQVGLLLKWTVLPGKTPKSGLVPGFRGSIEVVAEKDWWAQRASEVKRVWKKTEKDDAILFRPGVDRVSGLFDIDSSSLDSVRLREDIMFMSLHESYDALQEERNTRKKQKEGKRTEAAIAAGTANT